MINKYDFKKIGRRICSERKKLLTENGRAMTLEAFADEIGTTRQTLSKWEKGDETSAPSLWDLLRMCDMFDCELGYLLGEYECKTRAATDIKEETGLSETAITALKRYKEYDRVLLNKREYDNMALLNELISNNHFTALIDLLESAVSMTVRARFDRLQASTPPKGQARSVIVSSLEHPGYYEVEGDIAAKLYEEMAVDNLKIIVKEIVDSIVSDAKKEVSTIGND